MCKETEIDTVKLQKVDHLFGYNTETTISHSMLNESARSISRGISAANDHVPAESEKRKLIQSRVITN